MTISDAITSAEALTGQVVDNATLVRWLSELDGQLALTFYRAERFTPYDPATDGAKTLLVPFPWDGLYVNHLAAMTYFANGEYDRYENERTMSENTGKEYRAFMQRTQARPCRPGFPLPANEQGGTTT